ncbi:glycosyltransferase family 2 protein [Leptodesmis sp.]|uniref:glycosyltransferase family 2 protein n=1 Tax=Leptodesmis sp. TaxID=3100501 RepID=UPI0040534A61
MTLPSFSIVLETENLANADLEGLTHALASLVHQDLSPEQANEVILIDSGDVPPELLRQLCDRYPWIKVYPAPADTGYYKAKMLGAELATGEIIVYADSDCLYEPHWLRSILTTFAENPQIQIVAGETTTRGHGPYGTAMALVYIFPQFSGKTELTPTHQYFLNNVAFRRQFLLEHPIPAELPLYRGNCVVHGENLQREGHIIWLHPQARATHAPPSDLSHFFWRFLLIGHDYYWQKKLIPNSLSPISSPQDRDPTASSFTEKIKIFRSRMVRLLHNNPRHALYLPLAIPIILVAALLIYVGYLITLVSPNYLVKMYDRLLE